MATLSHQQDGPIKTQRLLLRGAQESDLEPLHEIFSDEEVMRYWSCAPHTTTEKTSKYLHDMMDSSTNGTLDFVIVLVSSPSSTSPVEGDQPPSDSVEKVIGKAGIWSQANSEIGFMLNRAYWKKGYMVEALTALLGPDGAFWQRGVERVLADVDPRNESSIGILKRFDFVETGREEKTFETHLGWCDSVYLELRKEKEAEGGRDEAASISGG